MRFTILVISALCLSGCAAIFDGTTEEITVNTNPPGAHCDLVRKGQVIASIANTPAAAIIDKTKNDLLIKCNKDGFAEAGYVNHSGVAGATYADVLGGITTGGLAWAVDSASGADNKYDSVVNLSLVPIAFVPAAIALPATQPAVPHG